MKTRYDPDERLGTVCQAQRCKGNYTEEDTLDAIDGILHCNKCNSIIGYHRKKPKNECKLPGCRGELLDYEEDFGYCWDHLDEGQAITYRAKHTLEERITNIENEINSRADSFRSKDKLW